MNASTDTTIPFQLIVIYPIWILLPFSLMIVPIQKISIYTYDTLPDSIHVASKTLLVLLLPLVTYHSLFYLIQNI